MAWIWVDRTLVLAVHEEQLAEHGGSPGLRDGGLLDSALSRPQDLAAYGGPDVQALSASYALGLTKNHALIDGNKRVSLVVTELFLDLNGYEMLAEDSELLTTWLDVSSSELTEEQLADWLRRHSAPK